MAELIEQSIFIEISLLLLVATLLGFIGILLKQPLIVSFIGVGLLVGPSGLDLVHSQEQIDLLSELGIAVLLFLVGIKLDIKLIRSLGGVSVLTGLGQVAFTSTVGYGLGLLLGLDHMTSLYVAIALTFSSTIIIVKLLSDKREIDSLHGQIALGFLIVQDLVVVIAMVALSTIGIGASEQNPNALINVILSAIFAVSFVAFFVRYIATPLVGKLAKTPELLLIFAVTQTALFATVGEIMGLGKEVGGLLAGISLASTPYRETIASRLGPLRDFLLLFFFVALGSHLDLSSLGDNLTNAAVFSLFVLIGNPLIVLIIMGLLGYRKRTGFLAGLTVAQISEFSLIFIAMGVSIGHVQSQALGLVTMVGIVTIAASTYMITYSHHLYALCEPMLGIFERKKTSRESVTPDQPTNSYSIIIFGLGRFGTALGTRLKNKNKKILGIDFNPDAVKKWQQLGIDAHYGDATDAEFIAELPIRNAEWIIATYPPHLTGLSYEDARVTLIQLCRSYGFKGKLAFTSHTPQDTQYLKDEGVSIVLEPFQDASDRSVEKLLETQ
ncbi:MAG: cation:proton antiporter [Vibrio ordalii]|uniref:cation:proton antiporter n=1 Tax=Vibrio ordalii TaxID=28174 RepID=UPI003F385B76